MMSPRIIIFIELILSLMSPTNLFKLSFVPCHRRRQSGDEQPHGIDRHPPLGRGLHRLLDLDLGVLSHVVYVELPAGKVRGLQPAVRRLALLLAGELDEAVLDALLVLLAPVPEHSHLLDVSVHGLDLLLLRRQLLWRSLESYVQRFCVPLSLPLLLLLRQLAGGHELSGGAVVGLGLLGDWPKAAI